jgi:uncharacterized protein (TIGR02597 family)
MIGKITANSNNTLTVTLDAGDSLSGIGTVAVPVDPDGAGPLTAQADQIDVMPYWTPASLFPNVPAGTEVFSFSGNEVGINFGTTISYAFSGSGWEDGDTLEAVDHSPLRFGAGFFMRNNSNAPLNSSMVGSVPMSSHRLRLYTLANNTSQEFYFAYNSPVPEALTSLQIPAVAGDQIFAFDNSAPGKNKGTITIWAYTGTGWEDGDTGDPITSSTLLQPGVCYVYRRMPSPTPSSVVWSHLQSYLQP